LAPRDGFDGLSSILRCGVSIRIRLDDAAGAVHVALRREPRMPSTFDVQRATIPAIMRASSWRS
jgi:hypothetical protein